MYIVNGKIYTDSTLLDEIVYNCKLILNDIVIKNEKLALQYETDESLRKAELRLMCVDNIITFLEFPWTYDLLLDYGYSEEQAAIYINDMNLVPESERDDLLTYGKNRYIEDYEELNKYYRSLIGLPEYGTDKFNVYLTYSDFPSNYDPVLIDDVIDLPIHEYPLNVIDVLQSSGCIKPIIEKYRSFNYSYLRYLGNKAMDLDNARRAGKFDILYMPTANADVQYRFQELYNKNKNIYLVKVYQDAYAYGSEYYDNMMIVMLLAQTFNDMIVDTPEWYIRKDVFDIRTVQYFLEAYNIPFFKEIPLKYQVKIVKSINNLIQSKSTIDNFDDILKIFNLRETHIYRYYLYKNHKKDPNTGEFVIDDDPTKMYNLEFIEVLLGDTYDNYIKDLASRVPYDELTVGDQYWDGTEDHDEVKKQLLEKDFIIEPTKYITIKADIVYGDYQKQLAYFLSMVFDSRVAVDDIYILVPSVSESTSFSLNNLLLFIECLCHLYYKTDRTIIRPEDMCEEVTQTYPDFVPDDEKDDWWMKDKYPETFTDKTYNHNRVYGFNPELDMNALKETISNKYTNYSEGNFFYSNYNEETGELDLSKLYLDKYIELPDRIDNLETLMDIYDNNIDCMEKLQYDILHSIGDADKLKVANYVFNEVYTKSFDYNFYGDCENLDQVLANRDYFLFNLYNELLNRQQTDPESASNDINTILSDIVSVLSFYLNRPSLDYLFALVSNTSFESILKYIYWMLDAFKSYKLHFINPITKYISDTPNMQLGNNMTMADTMHRTDMFAKRDKEYMWDRIDKEDVIRYVDDFFREKLFEILDIYTIIDPDPDDDYIYDGGSASTPDEDYEKIIDGKTAEEVYPFKIINGYKSYLLRYNQWNLDFNDVSYIDDSLIIDGGNVLDNMFTNSSIYYENFFKKIYDCGEVNTDKFVNNNFFLRIIDTQQNVLDLVATRTGLIYNEVEGQITLTEYWREWKSVNDFEILNDTSLLAALYDEGRIDLWKQIHDYHELPYGEDYDYVVNHPARRTTLYLLDELMNQNINISIEDVYPDGNNRTEVDWDFGSLPLNPGNVQGDKNFGEVPDDPGNVDDDYEFGEISDIYYITKLGNYDSSRVITIPRTIQEEV